MFRFFRSEHPDVFFHTNEGFTDQEATGEESDHKKYCRYIKNK